ncbi:hypothetical protein O3M35_001312 [Rhynocoris fuscipes]|uniref:Tetraspanin n=1 Tax=Rhynocoris fuscipes TaxID=488301 RepID=A0AAW1DR80_9HEMI
MLSFRSFSSATIKYSLFIFNLILAISGLVLLCLGVVIKGVYTEYEKFLDDRYLSASSLLIASGTLLFIFAFFGCCGAIKENRCMILVFSVLLSVVFILEIATGITGFILNDKADALLNRTLFTTMEQYNQSKELTQLWDAVQRNLDCCGVNNYTDWNGVMAAPQLPLSCCNIPVGATEYSCLSNTTISGMLHTTPCKTQLSLIVDHNAVTICAAALGFVVLQLIGIVFSCYLAKFIKASSYESV